MSKQAVVLPSTRRLEANTSCACRSSSNSSSSSCRSCFYHHRCCRRHRCCCFCLVLLFFSSSSFRCNGHPKSFFKDWFHSLQNPPEGVGLDAMVPSTDINPWYRQRVRTRGSFRTALPGPLFCRRPWPLGHLQSKTRWPTRRTSSSAHSQEPSTRRRYWHVSRVLQGCCSCDFQSLLTPCLEWDTSVSNHCSLCQQEREKGELNQLYFMGLSKTDQDRYLSTYCCEEDSLWFGLTETPDWEDDEERELVISRSALPKGSLLFEQVLGEVAPEVRALEDSSVTITCLRPQSLRSSIEKEADASHDDKKGLKKRISWADQKGLPLKSEVFFED